MAQVDDLLLPDHGAVHRVHQGPADAAAVTGVDEAVLRAGIQGIFPVNEFRMQHDIALLTAADDVRQAVPVDEILRTDHAGAGHGRREVALRRSGILPLHAEDAVHPAVLVRGQAHVIDIRRRLPIVRKGHRTVPEAEVVDAVRALGHGEEGLAVGRLHPHAQQVFVPPLDGAGVERGMDAEPLQQERIRLFVQVISPEKRGMFRRQDGVAIPLINTIHIDRLILFCQKGRMGLFQAGQSFFKRHMSVRFRFTRSTSICYHSRRTP